MSSSYTFNPIKAGGSESMYSLGGRLAPLPPLKKALEKRYRVEMHVHAIFQGQLIEKKLDRSFLEFGR